MPYPAPDRDFLILSIVAAPVSIYDPEIKYLFPWEPIQIPGAYLLPI